MTGGAVAVLQHLPEEGGEGGETGRIGRPTVEAERSGEGSGN